MRASAALHEELALLLADFQTSMSSGPLPGLAWTAPMTTWVADAVDRWRRAGNR